MVEIRIHGRGGQGVQTAAHLIAHAFFRRGRYVQSFATYGGERRGTPVTAFVRVAGEPVRRRCDVEAPHAVLLLDPTFLEERVALAGLVPAGLAVINTVQDPENYRDLGDYTFATVDAVALAGRAGLGRIVNTCMVGAFARASGWLGLPEVAAAIERHSPANAASNQEAARLGYEAVRGGWVKALVTP